MATENTIFGKHIQDWIKQLQAWCINTFGKVKTVNGVSPDNKGNVTISSLGYDKLSNLPSINSVTLTGNKTATDLNLAYSSHTHAISSVTDLNATLNGKAAKTHTHDEYATKKAIAENVTTKCIELSTGATSNGGYIDFHYAGAEEDYTSRIIENAKGVISIYRTAGGLGSLSLGDVTATTFTGTTITGNKITGTTYSGITAGMVTVAEDDLLDKASVQAHINHLTRTRPNYMSAIVQATPSNNISTTDEHWFVVHEDTYTYRYHTYFSGWYMIKSINCSVKLGSYESADSIGTVTLCTSNDGTQVFCLPLGTNTMIEFNTRDSYSENVGSFEFNILKGIK